jgi:hypothetical protein
MPLTVDDYTTLPLGSFHWVAQIRSSTCDYCDCNIEWDWTYTGSLPPSVLVAGGTVLVTAPLMESQTLLSPVSPGVLTLTATATCPSLSYVSGSSEPVALDPITLTIGLYSAGWLDRVNASPDSPYMVEVIGAYDDHWVGQVVGILKDRSVSWSFVKTPSNWSPTINIDGPMITVSNPGSGGTLVATPSITDDNGLYAVNPITLVLHPAWTVL